IVEAVNSVDWLTSHNRITLKTDQKCTQSDVPGISNNGMCGTGNYSKLCTPCNAEQKVDCVVAGCSIDAGVGTAGHQVNLQSGVVYVCEWVMDGPIKIWIFPRELIPAYVPFYATQIDTSKYPFPHVE